VEDNSDDKAGFKLKEVAKLEDNMLGDTTLLDPASIELDDALGDHALEEGISKEERNEEEALEDAGSENAVLELAVVEDAVLNGDATRDTGAVLDVDASEEDEETTLQAPKPF
jgi:hypothetical protein